MHRIRHKIFAALVTIILLMLAPTMYAVMALRQVNRLTTELRESSALRVEVARDLLRDCERFGDLHGVTRDTDYAREADRCAGRLSRAAKSIATQIAARQRELATRLQRAVDCYAGPGREPEDREICAGRIDAVLQAVQAGEATHRETLTAEVGHISRGAVNVLWICAGGTLIAAILITSVLAQGIVVPLRRILQGTQEVALGRFDHHIKVTTQDEIGELTREFNRMASDLESLNRMKAEFLSITSHELKAPITSILGYVDILRTEDTSLPPEERRRIVEFLEEESRLLLRYINQFLDMNRLETGQFRFESRDLPLVPFFANEVEGFAYRARRRGIELRSETDGDLPEEFRADPDRLGEVVRNLLGNALRYTPAGGKVTARLCGEGNGSFRFEVLDNGPGIAEEERSHVFNKYYRGVQSRGTRGSGLGLAISRAIAEAHGGEIWVESAEGGGARFICRLPISGAESRT